MKAKKKTRKNYTLIYTAKPNDDERMICQEYELPFLVQSVKDLEEFRINID